MFKINILLKKRRIARKIKFSSIDIIKNKIFSFNLRSSVEVLLFFIKLKLVSNIRL